MDSEGQIQPREEAVAVQSPDRFYLIDAKITNAQVGLKHSELGHAVIMPSGGFEAEIARLQQIRKEAADGNAAGVIAEYQKEKDMLEKYRERESDKAASPQEYPDDTEYRDLKADIVQGESVRSQIADEAAQKWIDKKIQESTRALARTTRGDAESAMARRDRQIAKISDAIASFAPSLQAVQV